MTLTLLRRPLVLGYVVYVAVVSIKKYPNAYCLMTYIKMSLLKFSQLPVLLQECCRFHMNIAHGIA